MLYNMVRNGHAYFKNINFESNQINKYNGKSITSNRVNRI